MNSLRRRDRSIAARDDEADGRERQCLDCYAIFDPEDSPGPAECDACGSSRTEPW